MASATDAPPIRAIVFDIGDVLFLGFPLDAACRRWAGPMGVDPDRLKQHIFSHGPDIEAANIGAITAEEYCRRCAGRLDTDPALVQQFIEELFLGERLNEELVAYIKGLSSRYRIAALTNNWTFGRALIERRGITELFDPIISSAEEGVKKPHPRIYEIALERLGVDPPQVVFVDDKLENIEAASALGLHGVQFRSTEQTIADLERICAEGRNAP